MAPLAAMRRLLLAIALIASPAAAQVRAVPAQPASEAEALRGVEVFLINEGDMPVEEAGPREIEVTAVDGTRLVLGRVPGPAPTIQPRGFAKLRYVPVGIAGHATPPAAVHAAAVVPAEESVVQSATGSSAAFVDRFEPHEPIYGVFGAGNAGAKLQVSFAFRPFSESAPLKLGNLRFAYTQTMFWALDRPSGPFRATNYAPEVYADIPVGDSAKVALGWRHDSNGRGLLDSVDLNRLFVRVEKRFDLGGDWRLDVAPQAWTYVGSAGTFHDMPDYFGNAGLGVAISQSGGLKLAITGRGDFDTGRGAAELFLSYPLIRVAGGSFYVFAQGFSGYGEALDDYRVNTTHARIGIALTR